MKKIFFSLMLLICSSAMANPDLKIVVPLSAGSFSDIAANIYSQCFSNHGFNTSKDNRPGADGLVAIQHMVANRDNTKQTHILFATLGIMIFGNYPNISIERDFTVVAQANQVEMVIYTKTGRYETLEEVFASAKNRPVTLGYAVPSWKFMAEKLFANQHAELITVPYKGSPQIATDIIGGNIDITMDLWSVAKPLVEQGRIRVLAAAVPADRARALNTVSTDKWDPTLSRVPVGNHFIVNAGTDPAIISRLRQAILDCNTAPNTASQFRELQAVPVTRSLSEVNAMLKDARRRYTPGGVELK